MSAPAPLLPRVSLILTLYVLARGRGKYQGIIGAVVAFGWAVGPLLGGLLAEKAGWRWCFWVTLPVSAAAVAFVMFVLPLKPVEGGIARKLAIIDYLGTALTLAGCTLVILPLIWVSRWSTRERQRRVCLWPCCREV